VKEFDLVRLRHNWDRAAEPPTPRLPPRLAIVEAPHDPYPEAARLLDRIDRSIEREFVEKMPALRVFMAEARALFARLEGTRAPSTDPGGPREDPAKLRAELQKVLFDLEDLLEVALGIGLS
jgi:hypothetical protein